MLDGVKNLVSRVNALPGLSLLQAPANRAPAPAALAGYLRCQQLAMAACYEISGLLQEGWTEQQAADLLDTYLRDHGVKAFFHKSFVWYGERTRFRGVNNYFDYLPSARVLRAGEPVILDVAPIFDGYISDVGYTTALGDHAGVRAARAFLADLRRDLPAMFASAAAKREGRAIWEHIDQRIRAAGYENIHATYPFSVLGHRVHRVRLTGPAISFIHFGWQSYWEFLSRGLFGQLLNGNFTGDLTGLWAIEPHIGTPDFGAKFEEILIVDAAGARWLDPDNLHH